MNDASRTREERTVIVRMTDEFLPICRNPVINREGIGMKDAANLTLGQELYPHFAKI